DCFALVARPGEPVLSLNGSGRSAAQATIDEALRRGLTCIADDDPLAVTIPGAVDAWCNLHSRFGVLGLDDLMEPAARRAEEGYVVAPRVAHDWNLHAERLARHPQTARRFLPNGRAPDAGDVHRQPALAATLRSIGKHGREALYAGPVAEDLVSTLAALGGPHTLADFAVQHSNYANPTS